MVQVVSNWLPRSCEIELSQEAPQEPCIYWYMPVSLHVNSSYIYHCLFPPFDYQMVQPKGKSVFCYCFHAFFGLEG